MNWKFWHKASVSPSSDAIRWKRAGNLLIGILGPLSAFSIAILTITSVVGEGTSQAWRVRQQAWTSTLYHSPYIDIDSYKRALLDYHKPQIAVIGTSRAGPFRGSFFTKPFVNLQSTVDSPEVLHRFVASEFLNDARLKHLIIVAELWWFADTPKPDTSKLSQKVTIERKLKSLWSYFTHRTRGKERRQEVLAAIGEGRLTSFMGIHGLVRREGFSAVGSFHYEQIVSGRRVSNDKAFNFSLNALSLGEHRFPFGKQLNETAWANFASVLALLEQRKIEYTVVLAPFAPTVANAMKPERFRHYAALIKRLHEAEIPYSDFTYPSTLGNDDCEYIDGFHGGDVVYARMLSQIVAKHATLRQFVDVEHLKSISETHRGSAAWSRYTSLPEIDFLELGCVRTD